MIEVDLNNGMFRKIDVNKPVYCVKCKKEIVRNSNSVNLKNWLQNRKYIV